MHNLITNFFNDSIKTKQDTLQDCSDVILDACELISSTFEDSNKILICGNGGSASDAQHLATELVVRFETKRVALPAIALTTDTSALTAISNDFSSDQMFSRQIEALGNSNDLLIAISTSGNSTNIILAIEAALNKKMNILVLSGNDGGKINLNYASQSTQIIIPSNSTARIQETHILIIHILCAFIDQKFT